MENISQLPWKFKTRKTSVLKKTVVWIEDVNGNIVLPQFIDDENGRVFSDFKYIVQCVNSNTIKESK